MTLGDLFEAATDAVVLAKTVVLVAALVGSAGVALRAVIALHRERLRGKHGSDQLRHVATAIVATAIALASGVMLLQPGDSDAGLAAGPERQAPWERLP